MFNIGSKSKTPAVNVPVTTELKEKLQLIVDQSIADLKSYGVVPNCDYRGIYIGTQNNLQRRVVELIKAVNKMKLYAEDLTIDSAEYYEDNTCYEANRDGEYHPILTLLIGMVDGITATGERTFMFESPIGPISMKLHILEHDDDDEGFAYSEEHNSIIVRAVQRDIDIVFEFTDHEEFNSNWHSQFMESTRRFMALNDIRMQVIALELLNTPMDGTTTIPVELIDLERIYSTIAPSDEPVIKLETSNRLSMQA